MLLAMEPSLQVLILIKHLIHTVSVSLSPFIFSPQICILKNKILGVLDGSKFLGSAVSLASSGRTWYSEEIFILTNAQASGAVRLKAYH